MSDTTEFPSGGVFVLGGSGALGVAICEAFARAGVPVALTYFRSQSAAQEAVDKVKALGVEARAYQVDASDPAAVDAALTAAADTFGGLHSVVYAGGPKFTPQFFSRTEQSVWLDWLHQDLMGALNLAQTALPHLRKTRGAYTAISSYQGEMVEIRGGPSAISKAAVDRMVKVIAKEEGRYGVRANTVRCGWIGTDNLESLYAAAPQLREEKAKTIPLGRVGYPREVAETVLFLSSARAGFITGVNLTADGGESL